MNKYQKVFITMARRNGKSLYRHMLNALYGKFPEYPMAQLELYNELFNRKGETNMSQEEKIYIQDDISGLAKLAVSMRELNERIEARNRRKLPGIKNVIFSGPCTIVMWEDGTKTIVRCEKDVLDPEKGLAMAIAKKALGTNKSGSNYYDIFKKWLPKEEEPIVIDFEEAQNNG